MDRNFELLPVAVQVILENGKVPDEVVSVLTEAARLVREKGLQGLIVISGTDDPATTISVSTALEAIHALDPPQQFRIAFVAYTLQQYGVYHFAEYYANKLGFAAKVMVTLRDARSWFGLSKSSSTRPLAEAAA